jgi:hypothetical protein
MNIGICKEDHQPAQGMQCINGFQEARFDSDLAGENPIAGLRPPFSCRSPSERTPRHGLQWVDVV